MKVLRSILAATAAIGGIVVLTPLIVVSLPIWAIAEVYRGIRRYLERNISDWQGLIEPCPVIGWKPKPDQSRYLLFPAGVFNIRTGGDGWPLCTSLKESNVVVFGDSFAFGYGVDHKHAFYGLTKDARVKAIGAPGYSMVQELLLMKDMAPQLAGKLVVWFLCFSNDLYDNLLPNLYQYRLPFARQKKGGAWEIVTSHVRQESWPFNYEKNFRMEEKFRGVFGQNPLSKRVYGACEFLIGQGRDICQSVNADLVLLSIPWPVQLNDVEWASRCKTFGRAEDFDRHAPDLQIQGIAERLGVPLVEGHRWLPLDHHIPNEGHWTERGHRQIARVLDQVYRERAGISQSGARSSDRRWSEPVFTSGHLVEAPASITLRQK